CGQGYRAQRPTVQASLQRIGGPNSGILYSMAMSECGSGSSPSEIECRQIAELLGDYFDGALPQRTVELLEWHVDGCAPCVAFMNTYKTTIAATRKLPASGMPAELKKRLLQVLRAQRAADQPTT